MRQCRNDAALGLRAPCSDPNVRRYAGLGRVSGSGVGGGSVGERLCILRRALPAIVSANFPCRRESPKSSIGVRFQRSAGGHHETRPNQGPFAAGPRDAPRLLLDRGAHLKQAWKEVFDPRETNLVTEEMFIKGCSIIDLPDEDGNRKIKSPKAAFKRLRPDAGRWNPTSVCRSTRTLATVTMLALATLRAADKSFRF